MITSGDRHTNEGGGGGVPRDMNDNPIVFKLRLELSTADTTIAQKLSAGMPTTRRQGSSVGLW